MVVALMSSSESDRASSALVTPGQAARELGVSAGTIRRWARSGELEAVRVGGRFRIARRGLERVVRPAGPYETETP